YGPWPDPWCLEGRAQDICGLLPATEIEVVDLTAQTLPTYGLMLPDAMLTSPEPNSAGDPLLQSLQMLHWLHEQQLLRYELITGTCS
ncbi:MAG: hypothetical protein KDA85_06575, partial [Planctomycetaceae bacterium]|nr:hypothetical protein [Planctomycetaceae bacterium]